MTPKQTRFVAEYLIDLNATQAAIRAGYKPKSAFVTGSRLLKDAKVAAAVEAGRKRQIDKAEASAEEAMREARLMALARPYDMYAEDGSLKPLSEWPEPIRAAFAGAETVRGNMDKGDGKFDPMVRVRMWDKNAAMDRFVKLLGMLEEQAKVTGTLVVKWGDE